ncbi:hypothetical protein [Phaeovulum sp. NW3]|uniref:hypothetical protein n=1 Tax=Phaeovulum sp. NW3 TaxID=2934933 RepID=UPI0020213163|nr:hypothetical protein [Phaeovulum sp. NW3]MCL7463888.1 hypothetical protein [Phaeovulum sp. NW3]
MTRFLFLLAILAAPGRALAQNMSWQHGEAQHGQHMPGMSHGDDAMDGDANPEVLLERGQ